MKHQYYNTLENTEHSYQISRGPRCQIIVTKLTETRIVCFDTETTGLDALHAELVGISFSFEKERLLCSFPEQRGRSSFD
jgi:DNA polymerase-1